MNKPHVHVELIKAWADGAQIEQWGPYTKTWFDCPEPLWGEGTLYRIKPERVFPKTSLTDTQLNLVWRSTPTVSVGLTAIANAAIKQYIIDTEK